MSNLKEILLKQCETFINKRLQNVQQNIAEVEFALTSETKNTAGDKHETGRAMLQLEREKYGQQLSEINQLKLAFSKINITKISEVVCLGSLVYTSQANYFIAISAGELQTTNFKAYAIAPNTPIGKLLIGKKQGETVIFRGEEITLLQVV